MYTRECQSFVFHITNRKFRLIDTPAINEKNFESILAYIAQVEYLNGICILLKPDESRLQNYT